LSSASALRYGFKDRRDFLEGHLFRSCVRVLRQPGGCIIPPHKLSKLAQHFILIFYACCFDPSLLAKSTIIGEVSLGSLYHKSRGHDPRMTHSAGENSQLDFTLLAHNVTHKREDAVGCQRGVVLIEPATAPCLLVQDPGRNELYR